MASQVYRDQFGFQREHSKGRVLNVGSNTDGAKLAADFGAINVDMRIVDHVSGFVLPVAVLADARALPFAGAFDTVVLGEILEHMEPADAVRSLREAVAAIHDSGQVVITMPHDGRRETGEIETPQGEKQFYAPGIYAYHYRSISRLELLAWIREAGLRAEVIARIIYVWGEQGSGIVARKWCEA